MKVKNFAIILVSVLLTAACKKNDPLVSPEPEPRDDLLVKRMVTGLVDSKEGEPFGIKRELLFSYDASNRLTRIDNKTIVQYTNDDTQSGEYGHSFGDFVYDGVGRLIRRNGYNQYGDLGWYSEFSYDEKGAIVQVTEFNNSERDPVSQAYVFRPYRYYRFTNNSDNMPDERITHEWVRQSNQELVMTPVMRTVFAYDGDKNVKSITGYPLVTMYGVLGKPSWMEEYRYASKGQDPLYFGMAHSSIYLSHIVSFSDVVFSTCAKPLISRKWTTYYERPMLPPTEGRQNYTIRSGPHGHPEWIKEVYVGEEYVAGGLENLLLITKRRIIEREIEYMPKQ